MVIRDGVFRLHSRVLRQERLRGPHRQPRGASERPPPRDFRGYASRRRRSVCCSRRSSQRARRRWLPSVRSRVGVARRNWRLRGASGTKSSDWHGCSNSRGAWLRSWFDSSPRTARSVVAIRNAMAPPRRPAITSRPVHPEALKGERNSLTASRSPDESKGRAEIPDPRLGARRFRRRLRFGRRVD